MKTKTNVSGSEQYQTPQISILDVLAQTVLAASDRIKGDDNSPEDWEEGNVNWM